MIKKKLVFAIILGVFTFNAFAQSNENVSLLSIGINPGFGNGKVHSKLLGTQHGLFNGGCLLLNVHISPHLTVSSGAGVLTFNSNPVVNGKPASTELDFLHLPLKVNYIAGKNAVKFTFGVTGFYNTHLKSATDIGDGQFIKESSLGENYGLAGEIGPVFRLSDKFTSSIILDHQFTISEATGTKFTLENYLVKFGIQYSIVNKKR